MYYIGNCPLCKGYGRLEVNVNTSNNKLLIICEECLAEWDHPIEALKNLNGKKEFNTNIIYKEATFDEIKINGWEKYIINKD